MPWTPPTIGELRHRIELQSPVETKNELGETAVTYPATEAKVWAKIEQPTGREFYATKQAQSDVTTVVTIRRYERLTPKYRIKKGTRTFEVNAVTDPNGRRTHMVVFCREVIPNVNAV